MTTSVVAVIPARFASTRFPAKPLARETGKYLIQHVFERVRLTRSIDRVIVATDDDRVADAARSFGGDVAMTSPDHTSGTDRIAEVARGLAPAESELILNVQGDEPEIDPADLDRLVGRMQADREAPMGTLACPFPRDDSPSNPNCVKVVVNQRARALYFSRSVIPYDRDAGGTSTLATYLLHLGVYAYRREFLLKFASMPPTPLERLEKLEQLRALENGFAIAVEQVERASVGIDTPEQYARFVARYRAATGQQ